MRCGILQWVMILGCANLIACANTPSANQPKAEAPSPAEETADAPSEPKGSGESDATSSAPTRTEEADTTAPKENGNKRRPLEELCDRIVERAEQKCPKKIAAMYAVSCRRYAKADKCESEITRALECQAKATDESLCAHQADPNCTEVTRQQKACEKGTTPVEQTQVEDLSLPSSWARISDSELGFTVAMPSGAALDSSASKRSWKVEEGGITYVVAETDAPSGKLNNASILRTITNYVGGRCQLKLKVHGELDIKGTTVVQYDSGCTDGTEWHGMMHFWNGKAVSTGFHTRPGNKGVLEPYYYSFAISK